jgi:hypothetical protein
VEEPDLPLLHTRTYEVRAYKESPERLRLRGRVHDQKPPGLYVEGDPEPLSIHEMVVDLLIDFPSLVISAVEVVMEVHPHAYCPTITDRYQELVGLSVVRGYTHRVRELFGGPRGCTHTTALLQAMGPVVHQSMWSMQEPHPAGPDGEVLDLEAEALRERLRRNLNTCHVWSEGGPMFAVIDAGGEPPAPRWISERLVRLGRDPDDWRRARR